MHQRRHLVVHGTLAANDSLGDIGKAGSESVNGLVISECELPLLVTLVGDGAAEKSLGVVGVNLEGRGAISDDGGKVVSLLVASGAVAEARGLLGADSGAVKLNSAGIVGRGLIVLRVAKKRIAELASLLGVSHTLGLGALVTLADRLVEELNLIIDLGAGLLLLGILEGLDRLVNAAKGLEGDTLAVVALEPVGAAADAEVAVREGLLVLAKRAVRSGTVGVEGTSGNTLGLNLNRLGVHGDGLGVVLHLEGIIALSLILIGGHG